MINDRASELPFSTAPPVYLSLKRYGRHRSLKLPPLDTGLSRRLFPRDYFNCFNASTAGQPSLCSNKPLPPRSSIFLLGSRDLKSSRARKHVDRKVSHFQILQYSNIRFKITNNFKVIGEIIGKTTNYQICEKRNVRFNLKSISHRRRHVCGISIKKKRSESSLGVDDVPIS